MISEADVRFPNIPFKQTAILIVLGLAIYLGYLYLVGFDSVKGVLSGADYRYLGLAMAVALAANALHTAGWWVYLRDKGYRISFFKAYQIYLASIFFMNLLPTMAVSGEVSKIYFVEKSTPGSRFDKTLATCVVSRALETIPIAAGAVVGVLFLALFYGIPLWATAFCLFIALALVAVAAGAVIVALNNALLRSISASGFRLLGRLRKKDTTAQAQRFDAIIVQFGASIGDIMAKKTLVVASLAFIFMAWCLDVSVAYVAFLAIGHPVTPLLVVTVYSVMVILQMLPIFLPGGIGVVDIVMTTLYMTVGIPKESAAGATIMVRFVTLWFLTTAGGLVTLYLAKAHGKTDAKKV